MSLSRTPFAIAAGRCTVSDVGNVSPAAADIETRPGTCTPTACTLRICTEQEAQRAAMVTSQPLQDAAIASAQRVEVKEAMNSRASGYRAQSSTTRHSSRYCGVPDDDLIARSVRNTASSPFFTRASGRSWIVGRAQLAEDHRRLDAGVDQRRHFPQRARRIGVAEPPPSARTYPRIRSAASPGRGRAGR